MVAKHMRITCLFLAASAWGLVACSSPPSGKTTGKATGLDIGHPIVFVPNKDAAASDMGSDAVQDNGSGDEAKDGAEPLTCDFPADPAPGEPGAPCTTASECDSGLCVESASGRVCTQACVDCCPNGFHCAQLGGVDTAFACLPTLTALCRPCLSDAECGALNAGALCVPVGSSGSFCGGPCDSDANCPASFACKAVQGEKGAGKQCIRTKGECACSPKATSDGAATSCATTNTAGTCHGLRKCGLAGLSACDAPTPATETCNGIDDDCDGGTDGPDTAGCKLYWQDSDGDGSGVGLGQCLCQPAGLTTAQVGGDCNDNQQAIAPGAEETCNGLDDNCNGQTDEGVGSAFYPDADQDGFGAALGGKTACKAAPGYVKKGGDCDDSKPNVHPNGVETCNGLDDNCDGQTDEDLQTTFFSDSDGDGYGVFGSAILACSAPPGFVGIGTDCDDQMAGIHPGAVESCNTADDDCNGQTDEGLVGKTWYADQDGDGLGNAAVSTVGCSAPPGFVAANTDCNDGAASVHPGAAETCNGADDDCDGTIDEDVKSTFFLDGDADGYGKAAATQLACSAPAGYAAADGDCDDAKPGVHPGAAEICNGADEDCNGATDEGLATQAWYQDADGDGFGSVATAVVGCQQPGGFVGNGSDCNDTNTAVHPGTVEICNGIDEDCNGQTDDGVAFSAWHPDQDGDGFGDAGKLTLACAALPGAVTDASDCDDTATNVNPDAAEACNGVDDNCNGLTDDGFSGSTWYQDGDSDGYGNAAAAVSACVAPPGYIASAGDCDDTKSGVHPGATEACNGADDDCNGFVDDGAGSIWYADSDGDAYGDAAVSKLACTLPSGYVANKGDCDDANPGAFPGALETCNGVDDNCEGRIDEGVKATFYQDADGDTYGNVAKPLVACANPGGYVSTATDCDDTASSIHPGAGEACNSKDDDCDSQTDEGLGAKIYYQDADGDGYGNAAVTISACSKPAGYGTDKNDCDDTNSSVNPGIFSVVNEAIGGCNGLDNDCNGYTDDGYAWPYYKDNDGDGYGAASSGSQSVCIGKAAPGGFSRDGADCDDANPARHPNALETFCDGVDDDCIGGDYCGATCQAVTLYDFTTGPQGWSVGGGWTWDFESDPVFGFDTYSLAYEKDKQTGYPAAAGGATTSTWLNIPNGAKMIRVSVQFKNSTGEDINEDKIPDTAATVTLTLGANSATPLGPSATYDGTTHKVQVAVNPAWWKTQVQLSITVKTPNSSTDSWSGYFIDDIQVVCN